MSESGRTQSILVIEDDPSYRGNIEMILKMEGFRVRTAADGRSGLAAVQEEVPDLILCDIMMPEMDGHTMFDILKSDVLFADVAFIFVTALADRSELRRAMAAGADDYLTKPFTAEELLAAVTGRLNRLRILRQSAGSTSFHKDLAWLREQLTPREHEVLLRVGRGDTSRQIADRLGISVKTVEIHRSNLMHKLNASNAATLARWAFIAEQR
ncbi:response regulator transcription factor [Trichlorobacter ammonificans]|uniref:DNA-binding response regulator n=1 Tax=Trichlorobacter ammonificans TaxID=2916410 RepID=A0ABM9D9K0_9BACT|nr:response regulator transcription factor [Trichlorobacter ammonificans]CAH2031832.1 conserved protein of unknown function [Trichlorobacter ammonificans]